MVAGKKNESHRVTRIVAHHAGKSHLEAWLYGRIAALRKNYMELR